MTRETLENPKAYGISIMKKLQLGHNTETLAGNKTLTNEDPPLQFLDPGGAGRTITLPAEAVSEGLTFIIHNTADALEVLTIQDDGAATIVTPTQDEAAVVYCDGVTWHGFVAAEA